MAGFRKAKGEQAALKMSMYGPPGSGKTFTALLIAEGLANLSKKRIAYVDTERGTDFYAQAVPNRQVHPDAFDFDALYSKSLTEVLAEVKSVKPDVHGVIIIDSISHLWDAAKASYAGKTTKVGSIPMWAWQKIKAPYKDLVNYLINSPFHVLILGRQGNDFQEDEETGEIKTTGYKMKAEGETPYEPHICLRMEPIKDKKKKAQVITAFAEKDRTGILSGQTITWPSFENIARPMLGLLGATQAQIQTEEEAGAQDAEALAAQDKDKERSSQSFLDQFRARFALAKTKEEVQAISKEITPALKKIMLTAHVNALREAFLEHTQRVTMNGVPANGQP